MPTIPMLSTLLALGLLGSPLAAQTQPAPAQGPAAVHHAKEAAKEAAKDAPKPIDLNHASREELLKLPGVTPRIVDRILARRPFLTKSKLASEKVIPLMVYAGIKDRVFVQSTVEDAKKAAAKEKEAAARKAAKKAAADPAKPAGK